MTGHSQLNMLFNSFSAVDEKDEVNHLYRECRRRGRRGMINTLIKQIKYDRTVPFACSARPSETELPF